MNKEKTPVHLKRLHHLPAHVDDVDYKVGEFAAEVSSQVVTRAKGFVARKTHTHTHTHTHTV